MSTLENTYCKYTIGNLKRYENAGWTYIKKLNDGNDFIVARRNLGREICHLVNKDSNLLKHLKLLENTNLETCYDIIGIKELPESLNSVILSEVNKDIKFIFPNGLVSTDYTEVSVNNEEKVYPESKIKVIIEHIISLQKHFTGGSYIKVDEMIKELNKFGFYPNPIGKDIQGR